MSEADARRLAAKLAREAFDARTDLRSPDGARVLPSFEPSRFEGGLKAQRWSFRFSPPSGASARVSFDRLGGNPVVEVGYSDE
jgi:hypothetical protein